MSLFQQPKDVYTVSDFLKASTQSDTSNIALKRLRDKLSVENGIDILAYIDDILRLLGMQPGSKDIVDALLDVAWSFSAQKLYAEAAAALALAVNPHLYSSYNTAVYPWDVACRPESFDYTVGADNEVTVVIEACGRVNAVRVWFDDELSRAIFFEPARPPLKPLRRIMLSSYSPSTLLKVGVVRGVSSAAEIIGSLLKELERGNLMVLVNDVLSTKPVTHAFLSTVTLLPLFLILPPGKRGARLDYEKRRGVYTITASYVGGGGIVLKLWRTSMPGVKYLNVSIVESEV